MPPITSRLGTTRVTQCRATSATMNSPSSISSRRSAPASTRAIADALGIARDQVLLTYQSRFGRERWLQPYTQATLETLAREGVRTIDVACPGFAVDCLETLEEIAVENAHAFTAAGGEALRYIPCLNAGDAHAQALAMLARGKAGWA